MTVKMIYAIVISGVTGRLSHVMKKRSKPYNLTGWRILQHFQRMLLHIITMMRIMLRNVHNGIIFGHENLCEPCEMAIPDLLGFV